MSLSGALILDCLRTPRARVKADTSALSGLHLQELLGQTLKATVDKSGVEPALIEDVIIGWPYYCLVPVR
jgi:acetyl-CoA acetyltransferase